MRVYFLVLTVSSSRAFAEAGRCVRGTQSSARQSSSPLPHIIITGTVFGSPTTERRQRSRPARRSAVPESDYARKHAVHVPALWRRSAETWPQALATTGAAGASAAHGRHVGGSRGSAAQLRARPTTAKQSRPGSGLDAGAEEWRSGSSSCPKSRQLFEITLRVHPTVA